MKRVITIYLDPDTYEVTIQGNLILRIVRFIGESQITQERCFDSLSDAVKEKLIEAINE